MKRLLLGLASHLIALAIGFAAGIYVLPILTAPEAPSAEQIVGQMPQVRFRGEFRRDLADSDPLHWGEGRVSVSPRHVALVGRLAPGPDYKLYLSPEFVETKQDFLRIKPRMVRIGDVKTFRNFLVPVPEGVDVARYDTVVVWCETFSMFISAAKYR